MPKYESKQPHQTVLVVIAFLTATDSQMSILLKNAPSEAVKLLIILNHPRVHFLNIQSGIMGMSHNVFIKHLCALSLNLFSWHSEVPFLPDTSIDR